METGDDWFEIDAFADKWAAHCTELGQDGWELISYESKAASGREDNTLRVLYSGFFKRIVEL